MLSRLSVKAVLWGLSVLYQTYTGAFGGPLMLVLKDTEYKSYVGLISGALYLGLASGITLENILEKYLKPATISMVGAWILSTCMGGYLLLFTMEVKILPLFLFLRLLEGMSAVLVFDGILFQFKQFYEENIEWAMSRRSMATSLSFTLASMASFYLADKLSVKVWQLLNGCAVSLMIASFCTILRIRSTHGRRPQPTTSTRKERARMPKPTSRM